MASSQSYEFSVALATQLKSSDQSAVSQTSNKDPRATILCKGSSSSSAA